MRAEAGRLANEILDLSRSRLLVSLRFMDMALSRHRRVPYDGTFGADGNRILFEPGFILKTYMASQEDMVRRYLHLILHCVFRHPFVGTGIEERLWDLACDIAVESSIRGLAEKDFCSDRDEAMEEAESVLQNDIRILTAEKIYLWLKNTDLPDTELNRLESLYRTDDHTPWYVWKSSPGAEDGEEDPERGNEEDDAGFWERVSRQVLMDLESFSRDKVPEAGNLIQNLRSVNRERYDYETFLRKFASLQEDMKVNDNEFDYIYYTYGLSRYGNMPLVEPLEYREVKKIREFVIAIDTSGSVQGELVQSFLQKTYNVLMQEDSYASRVNIHILQSDAAVQEDVHITNRDEFTDYLKTMSVRGLGGTDFRPVFRYIDRLIEEKALHNLKGMIYFTDGKGIFPEKKPPYSAAFVFIKDDYELPAVPPWAIRLVLQREDIAEGNG